MSENRFIMKEGIFVKHNQVCNSTKEELLATSKTVEDFCAVCLDENVHCRIGNHRLGSTVLQSNISRNNFKISARMLGSKLKKGMRANVYSIASKCSAMYFQSRDNSIYYNDNDLHINLVFESAALAQKFLEELDTSIRYFQLSTSLEYDKIQSIPATEDIDFLFSRHYNSKDENSEEYSIAITRISHIENLDVNDETSLLMIEDPQNSDFVGLNCYICHLKSQSAFPSDKDDPNNVLMMSWSMHQRFDGLCTITAYRVPQIAISFHESVSDLCTIMGFERYTVKIAIEVPDEAIFEVVANRVKSGSKINKSEKIIYTTLYVKDVDRFKEFLQFKYNETKQIWKMASPGVIVENEIEAHQLRRSAREKVLIDYSEYPAFSQKNIL